MTTMSQSEFDPETARSSDHEVILHHYMCWRDVRVDLVRRSGLKRQETSMRSNRHVLMMNLQGQAEVGEDFINGRRIPFAARTPGSLIFIPADNEWTGWDEGETAAAYAVIAIDSGFVERAVPKPDGASLRDLRPRIGFHDHVLEHALKVVLSELRRPDLVSEAVVRSQALAIAAQLLRLDRSERRPKPKGRSPARVRKIIELIERNSDRSLSLMEMGMELELDPVYLSRIFKKAVGVTPHAFMARRRNERAAELLRVSDLSITEIAHSCGFTGSSHFSTAFRRALGMTPTDYRRSWKSLLR